MNDNETLTRRKADTFSECNQRRHTVCGSSAGNTFNVCVLPCESSKSRISEPISMKFGIGKELVLMGYDDVWLSRCFRNDGKKLIRFDVLGQCFSTAGPWHQLYRAARDSPGICHFSFLSNFHE